MNALTLRIRQIQRPCSCYEKLQATPYQIHDGLRSLIHFRVWRSVGTINDIPQHVKLPPADFCSSRCFRDINRDSA